MVKAVLWDFGGVLTTSPFESFNRYEAERGIPRDFIRMNNADNPHGNAWALFERSEVSIDEFDALFAEETEKKGHRVPGRDVIALLAGDVRPEMVEALRRVNEQLLTGCITNNVRAGTGAGMSRSADQAAAVEKVMEMFQVIIESSKVGVRKPSPEIYQIACEKLGVKPEEAVYLDDLGINLKPAREMGMHTIKVMDPLEAIKALEQAVGFPLR